MTRFVIVLTVLLAAAAATSPASARCIMSYCKEGATTRSHITNTSRQIVGDLYDPGHGRRIQIRDTDRRIIGYIERDGRITNPSRQPAASIEALRD